MQKMQILIDGDACRKIDATEKIASEKGVPCHIYCSTGHILESSYSRIHIMGEKKDSVDFAIVNKCQKGDIVVTDSSSLAAMVLAKCAYAINQKGFMYNDKNIMAYLDSRHMRRKETRCTNRQQVKCSRQISVKTAPYTDLLMRLIEQNDDKIKQ